MSCLFFWENTCEAGDTMPKKDYLKKILIIEDDADISGMIAATLEKHSFACAAAYSGTEGLMCLRSDSFDLVLLDLMLPGKSGETVLRVLCVSQDGKRMTAVPFAVPGMEGPTESQD